MSDTTELVEWSLEQRCPLRKDHFPAVDVARNDSLSHAKSVSRFPDHLVNGIYISSYNCKDSRCGRAYAPYPSRGFDTSEVFADYGGLAGVQQICGSCPANTSAGGLAGCFGSIYQPPDYEPLQEQLNKIIIRLGLQSAVAEEFPQIEPLWRGLWARSPLTAAGIGLVRAILAEMLVEDSQLPGVDARQLEELLEVTLDGRS